MQDPVLQRFSDDPNEALQPVPSRLTPVALMLLLAVAGLAFTVLVTISAIQRPWLGLSLVPGENGETVEIVDVAKNGPVSRFLAPLTLQSMGAANGPDTALSAQDLLEEPDTLETYSDMAGFFARQTALDALLRSGPLTLTVKDATGAEHRETVTLLPARPMTDLPSAFWVQIFVGLAAYLIGIWVWALRPRDPATILFALASFGILGFTFPAALYSTRELALDGTLFARLSMANHGGALFFGAAMLSLLLSYPRPLVSGWLRLLPFAVFGLWWLGDTLRWFEGPPMGSHMPTLIEMIGMLIAPVVQYWRAGNDAGARTVLRWFGATIAIGAGSFVLTVIAPNLIGAEALLPQSYAFTFFLLIHAGLALGVSRYRLFSLDRWAFNLLYYLLGAVLLVVIDVLLISLVTGEHGPITFGVALLATIFLYLPLRDSVGRWLAGRRADDREKWFHAAVDVALAPGVSEQRQRWNALLEQVFAPLSITPAAAVSAPQLLDEGMTLAMPAIGMLPALHLAHARKGRRLFTPQDRKIAGELHLMVANAIQGREAYERGVAEERRRITGDMHDNIGVQLMSALHSPDVSRKDTLIRETLSDLRDIINDTANRGLTLEELMADLRVELSEWLEAAGIALRWDVAADLPDAFSARAVLSLRSILREGVGNAVRHGKPKTVHVRLTRQGREALLEIEDDGAGFDPSTIKPGNGLSNLKGRIESLHGTMAIVGRAPGTAITARFPLGEPS